MTGALLVGVDAGPLQSTLAIQIELHTTVVDVALDGAYGDSEQVGDLTAAEPTAHQARHLALPIGQWQWASVT